MKPTDWEVIDSAIELYAPSLSADHHAEWYHRFYAAELEEIPELKEGSGWTESGRILLFEARYRERRLSLIISPGPQATRQRLYELAQRAVPGVKHGTVKKPKPCVPHRVPQVYSLPEAARLRLITRTRHLESKGLLRNSLRTTTGRW